MDNIAIIQARFGSTRLPGKISLPIGDTTLLGWIIRRLQAAHGLSEVIVATTTSPVDDSIASLVPSDVRVVRGSENDVLGRFLAVLDRRSADGVVRVCADNPFIDPTFLDAMLERLADEPDLDYLSYARADGTPTILTSLGFFAEWVSASALRRVDGCSRDPLDREHVTRYVYHHPEQCRVRLLPIPIWLDRDDLRLTVDHPADWENVQEVFRLLGPGQLTPRAIADCVDRRPDLLSRMRGLIAGNPKK